MTSSFAALTAAMDPAMLVVTVAVGDERDGCLVGFHSQCSIDPPRYAVWLSIANRTHELACRATHLGVHLLGADDHALAERFGGQTGDEVDKLRGIRWTAGPASVPLLAACPNRFVGRIVQRSEAGGDHVAYELDPIEVAVADPPLPLRLRAASDITPGHDAHDRR